MDDDRAATLDDCAEEAIDASKCASMFKQSVRHNMLLVRGEPKR
ncbi:hypothetical protein [Bradyrhizobium brasilense]|nr:hypothetical protein [Bradyrhizobium brasilense]